ncbi:MAG: hypothetical protein E7099_01960 [Mediterranea massiliensis]|nr:hypothetical protein [Mediterranea massiliensis]
MKQRRFLSLMAMCLMAVWVCAQQPTATEVLKKTAASVAKNEATKVDFTFDSSQGIIDGTIYMQAGKMHLDTDYFKLWFDGKNQWVYMPHNGEVNLTEPNPAEMMMINPFAWLMLAGNGYQAQMGTITQLQGKAVFEVILKAENNWADLEEVTFYLDKNNYSMVRVSAKQRGGEQFLVDIREVQPLTKQPDTFFQFDEKKYPEAMVIDMR